MLSAPTRRVRRLHLRAATAEQARRGAILVEDALRTASFPSADRGRLLVIRRLALPNIDPRNPASAVALQLESAVQSLESGAVRYDSPEAGQATAVYFEDTTTALVELARRLSLRLPVSEWFWRSALPRWSPLCPRSESWRWLLEESQSHPAAPAAIAAVALSCGSLDELFAATPDARAAIWLRSGFGGDTAPAAAAVPFQFSATAFAWIAHRLALDPEPDRRIQWLATMLALAQRPALAADPSLPARVQATLAWIASQPARPASPATVPASIFPPASSRKPAGVPGSTDRDRQPEPPHAEPRDNAPSVTNGAGLLFLIPLLRRLGLETRLAATPVLLEAAFPARLLLHVGHRFGLDARDPLVLSLGTLLPDTPAPEAAFTPWVAALRRACRDKCSMNLHAVIARSGHLHRTPAHLDLVFDPAQADLRLRRAGLDLDPGWVPWLGLVVRYQYSDAR